MTEATWGELVTKAEKEGGFELIPAGTYDFQVVGSDPGETTTFKPRIRVKATILSGPLAGKNTWKDLVFDPEPSVMAIRVQELQAMGIDPGQYQGTIEQVVSQLAPALINTTFKAQLTHRKWQGQTRNNLGIFQKRDGGGVVTPATPGVPTPAPATPATPTELGATTTPAPVTMPESADPPPDPDETPF